MLIDGMPQDVAEYIKTNNFSHTGRNISDRTITIIAAYLEKHATYSQMVKIGVAEFGKNSTFANVKDTDMGDRLIILQVMSNVNSYRF